MMNNIHSTDLISWLPACCCSTISNWLFCIICSNLARWRASFRCIISRSYCCLLFSVARHLRLSCSSSRSTSYRFAPDWCRLARERQYIQSWDVPQTNEWRPPHALIVLRGIRHQPFGHCVLEGARYKHANSDDG